MTDFSPLVNDPAALHDAQAIRHAGAGLLSLALMDSRNRLLALLAQDEANPAVLRLAARAGWFQEYWIARHVQRSRGEACDHTVPRLAGIEPAIDGWLQAGAPPPLDALRQYLADSLDVTLALLDGGDAAGLLTGVGLYVYRLSLQHEDRVCEWLGRPGGKADAAWAPPARPQRPPLWMPAQRWQLGSPPGGFVPWPERWAHEVQVPEFEIDAQAVNWAQFTEFAQDSGYDRAELWSREGWAWAQQQRRRAPRFVEQLRGGVLVSRGGALQRAAAGQPALHLSRHEAQAWCQWAGRRLPTEVEWEIAACSAASRGFVWGDVFEWVAGSARAYAASDAENGDGRAKPAAGPPPGCIDLLPNSSANVGPGAAVWADSDATDDQPDRQTDGPGVDPPFFMPKVEPKGLPTGVLRGASLATPLRWRHPRGRRYVRADDDSGWVGFRSCAL